MIIRAGNITEIKEIAIFYDEMCKVLAKASFLPCGNKGGFPSEDMIYEAVENRELFVGIENDCIMAAYILNHLCDNAYDKVKWQIDAAKTEVSIMHALRVSPEYGGRGCAKRLVEHAIETAKQNKQKAIRLDCLKVNSAPQKMYLSYGFRYIDSAVLFYEDIGTEMNCLLYELLLHN